MQNNLNVFSGKNSVLDFLDPDKNLPTSFNETASLSEKK